MSNIEEENKSKEESEKNININLQLNTVKAGKKVPGLLFVVEMRGKRCYSKLNQYRNQHCLSARIYTVLEGRESENSDVATEETLSEQTFVVNTNYAEIVLTNKGGDIISYKLKKHYDMKNTFGNKYPSNIYAFIPYLI